MHHRQQFEQFLHSQSRPASGDQHEWIRGLCIREAHRNGTLQTLLIFVEDPGMPPDAARVDMLIGLARLRVKWMGDLDVRQWTYCMNCSR